jgi:hypothetical protein
MHTTWVVAVSALGRLLRKYWLNPSAFVEYESLCNKESDLGIRQYLGTQLSAVAWGTLAVLRAGTFEKSMSLYDYWNVSPDELVTRFADGGKHREILEILETVF